MRTIFSVEYSALTLELSLGIEHQWGHGVAACAAYQAAAKTAPILQAWTVAALLSYTTTKYCTAAAEPPSGQNPTQPSRHRYYTQWGS